MAAPCWQLSTSRRAPIGPGVWLALAIRPAGLARTEAQIARARSLRNRKPRRY